MLRICIIFQIEISSVLFTMCPEMSEQANLFKLLWSSGKKLSHSLKVITMIMMIITVYILFEIYHFDYIYVFLVKGFYFIISSSSITFYFINVRFFQIGPFHVYKLLKTERGVVSQ